MRSRRTALVALVALSAAACRPDCTPARSGAAPIVLLVTVDTLRADHVGAYGATRVRTPSLDRLAAGGMVFERSYAQANVTLPSHASILTSLPLARHGVITNAASQPPVAATLPALFAAAGYHAGAFVSVVHLGPKFAVGGALQGLERFDAPRRVSKPLRAAETTDRLLDWLRAVCREPTFAWVHLWDPHMPYVPPAPYDRAYYAGNPRDASHDSMAGVELDWVMHDLSSVRRRLMQRRAEFRAIKRRLDASSREARRAVLYPDLFWGRAGGPAEYHGLLDLVRPLSVALHRSLPYNPPLAGFLTGVRDVEFPRAQYAGEVSYVDQEIGRLVQTLADWGLAERTILLVTADHGEGLGEHGVYFNHFGEWDETLHVPLIVWAPGRVAPGRTAALGTGLDVAPTLLRLAGLAPAPGMEGRDLFDPRAATRRVVTEHGRALQIAIRDRRWKLVRTLRTFHFTDAVERDAGTVELFDAETDPAERTNRLAAEPAVAAALAAELDAWLAAHGIAADGRGYEQAAATPLPPERREQLRALGYATD